MQNMAYHPETIMGFAKGAGCSGVLLVEVLGDERFADSKAAPFPFVAGYLAARRIPYQWLCLVAGPHRSKADPLLFDPDTQTRRALLAEVVTSGASHVMLSEVPSPAFRKALTSRGLSVTHCAVRGGAFGRGGLADWLGASGPRGGFLPDLAAPVYRCRPLGRPPAAAPLTPLVGGAATCLYAASVASNPAYRGVDLAGVARDFGCAFCPGPSRLSYAWRTPPLELALRQIRAVQAEPRTVWSRSEFAVRSPALFHGMAAFLRRLEREGVSPVALHFGCRADEVLTRARGIATALRVARRRGHTIHVSSMGAENFSPAENQRLNKGLAVGQLRRALALLRGWEKEYPETFFFSSHGGLGFILFTPWTTLADLRLNVRAARELGLAEHSFFLTRRAMLLPDVPITRLARRDGLTKLQDPESRKVFAWLRGHCDPGCRHFVEEEDIPWRFRDPLVGAVCALAARMAKREVVAGDPHHGTVLAAVREAGLESRLLDAFAILLDAAEAHRGPPTAAALLEGFRDRLRRSPDARAAKVCFPVFARAEALLDGFRLQAVERGRGKVRLVLRRKDGELHITARSPRGAWRLSCDGAATADPARHKRVLAVVARLLAVIGPSRLGILGRSLSARRSRSSGPEATERRCRD